MLKGGCFCGAIRYEVAGGVFHSTLCHCSDCRRVAAAPAVAWFSVNVGDFRIVAGAPRRFASSLSVERQFCGDCGTGLTFQHAELAGEIDVTTCSLDTPEAMPPEDQTWTRSRLSWLNLGEGVPNYSTTRDV